VKPYLAILSSRFRMMLQYRAAAIAGVGTQVFFGIVRMMIYDAFYGSSKAVQPMSHGQVITYIWLGQAMLLLVMLDVDRDVAAMVRTGSVAYELIRPVDLYGLWFSRAFSGRAAPLIMRSIPIFVIASLFFGLGAPVSFTAAGLFLVSAIAGLALASAITTLITISVIWTVSGDGIGRLVPPLVFFCSGIGVPLPLFPDWLQRAIAILPFRGLIDTPFRIYMGHLAGGDALTALAQQGLWIVGLVLAGRMALQRGMSRLVVQGG
jgi:viologen exporter family transport system permease protein